MLVFIQYILPALIGAVSAIITVCISTHVQNRKVTTDDDASLRTALMQERKQLTSEIQQLQQRCDSLEETNTKQAQEMWELQKQNKQLVHEIKCFGKGLPDEENC